jgi:hypothetical protein
MLTHQGCPQTPGGRLRALGFASTRTRGRRRGPRTDDVSVSGLAGITPGILMKSPAVITMHTVANAAKMWQVGMILT